MNAGPTRSSNGMVAALGAPWKQSLQRITRRAIAARLTIWITLWRVLSVAGAVALICVAFLGVRELSAQMQAVNRWHSISEVVGDGLTIYSEYPEAVGRGSTNTFRIGAQNRGNNLYQSVQVFVVGDGKIWFSGRNHVEFDSLSQGIEDSAVLTFTVSSTLPDATTSITPDILVEYSPAQSGPTVPQWIKFSQVPTLIVNHLIEFNEISQKGIASGTSIAGTLVAAVTSALTGFALMRGRFREFVSALIEIFRE